MGFYGTQREYMKEVYPRAAGSLNSIVDLLFPAGISPDGQADRPWKCLDHSSEFCLWEELDLRVRALLRYIDDNNTTDELAPEESLLQVIQDGLDLPFCKYEAADFKAEIKRRQVAKKEHERRTNGSNRALMLALQAHDAIDGVYPPSILEIEGWLRGEKRNESAEMTMRIYQIVRSVRCK